MYISTSSNRSAHQWCFFTFPQCQQVTKENYLSVIRELGDLEFYCIVKESHEDGSPHLHALVKYVQPITKSKVINHLKKKYPDDYKRQHVGKICRKSTPWNAWQYLLKEDTNPLTDGEPPRQPNPHGAFIAKYLRDNGFESIEALSEHVRQRRELIDGLDRQLLRCIANIDHYMCDYVLEFSEADDMLIKKFRKNYSVEFSGIDISPDGVVHVQNFIKRFIDPVINL